MGIPGAGMVDARRLSDDFAKKAESDLELAQEMARSGVSRHPHGSARLGHSLGSCMHLAQQSLEKGLKSAVLQVDGILGVPGDDASVNCLLEKWLGHQIYPGLCKYRSERLEFLRPAEPLSGHGPGPHANGALAPPGSRQANLRLVCDFWAAYSGSRRQRSLEWKRSVGMCLEDDERRELGPKHATYGGLLASLVGRGSLGGTHFSPGQAFPAVTLRACLDAGALASMLAEHASGPQASGTSAAMEREFRACQVGASALAGDERASRDPYTGAARRAMLEFGMALLLCHSGYYMALFPHATLGRYPWALGGDSTTDLYGRQAGHVLHHLFVGVPHSLGQMSGYSGRMRSLWDAVAGS